MSAILQDLSVPALVEAIDANLCEFWASFGRVPECEAQHDPEMLRVITPIPHPMFNGVFRARLSPRDIDAKIDVTLACFQSRHVPLLWWTGPSTRPADLGEHLEAHGLIRLDQPGLPADIPGMAPEWGSATIAGSDFRNTASSPSTWGLAQQTRD
jgi:hypothetical protein